MALPYRVPSMPQPESVVQLAAVERSGMAANGQVYGEVADEGGHSLYTVLPTVPILFLFVPSTSLDGFLLNEYLLSEYLTSTEGIADKISSRANIANVDGCRWGRCNRQDEPSM